LIKVGLIGDTQLQLAQTLGMKGRYICLSHCWGTTGTFKTTTENLEEMLEGFAFAKLPSTYKDAVVMTRLMGVPFLWIDSLCIIQNDRDDWLHESAQMMEVYTNAFLTLAATGGTTPWTGMFHNSESVSLLVDQLRVLRTE
jgi:hypothetical protein